MAAAIQPGDFIKVRFMDKRGQLERMWVRVTHATDRRITGTLDNEPVGDHRARLVLGATVYIAPRRVIEHLTAAQAAARWQ